MPISQAPYRMNSQKKENDFIYSYSNSLDKNFQDKTFRQMALAAMKIWSKFGSNENGCKILLSQLRSYSEYNPPYDMEYTDGYDTPELWWSTCRQPKNYIQKLALKLLAITPHQAACERAFSILNWMTGKRRTRYLYNFNINTISTYL